jgi:hypothetical protein
MARDDPSFHLRLPVDLQRQVKVAAAENDRSMNAEIVARLERTFAGTAEADRKRVMQLLTEAIAVVKGGG